MTVSKMIAAVSFAVFVMGLSATPLTYDPFGEGLTVKDAWAKEKKEKKEKREKKEKKEKREKREKDCTRAQPCNDNNSNRNRGDDENENENETEDEGQDD